MNNAITANTDKRFVTVRQAVKITGLSECFIRGALQRGQIPHIKVGNKNLINLPLFAEWLDSESRMGGTNGK